MPEYINHMSSGALDCFTQFRIRKRLLVCLIKTLIVIATITTHDIDPDGADRAINDKPPK